MGSPFVVGMTFVGVELGFWRLGRGEVGSEGGRRVLEGVSVGGGVVDLVMLRILAIEKIH